MTGCDCGGNAHNEEHANDCAGWRLEVERLREALREMVDAHGDSEGATPNRRRQCSCSACDAARAALAGKEKP